MLFLTLMNRILRRSREEEGVQFGNIRVASLLFADDVVLLASPSQDFQLTLERFMAKCEAAGMKVNSFDSEANVLNRKKVGCFVRG